jgi:uncharacterized protein involved in response to NO
MPAGQESPLLARTALFGAGFRPFFLLAGMQAALVVPLWLLQRAGGLDLHLAYASLLWHGHEMVFGFGGAAVAGFLLTAVPNWTGAPPVRGGALAFLTVLWLLARIALALGSLLPPWVGAALALPFLPSLAIVLAKPLIQAGKFRNAAFLPILIVLILAQVLVLAEMVDFGDWGITGLDLGIFVLLVMIAIIGGRVIPWFTANELQRRGIGFRPRSHPGLDLVAIVSLVLAGGGWLFMSDDFTAGSLAIAAAALNGVRLAGWGGWKTLRIPLLWVLHLAYAWMVIGLLLLGLSQFYADILPQVAMHALVTGCIGLMTLGIMSRAALGHSGRPLRAAPLTVAAYVLVALAALFRVFGTIVYPLPALWLSGVLWSGGFAFYVAVYAPICLKPPLNARQLAGYPTVPADSRGG